MTMKQPKTNNTAQSEYMRWALNNLERHVVMLQEQIGELRKRLDEIRG